LLLGQRHVRMAEDAAMLITLFHGDELVTLVEEQ